MKNQIGIIAGSLRKESFSRKIGKALIDMTPEVFDFRLVSLDDLPIYNQDFDDYDQVPELFDGQGALKEGSTKEFLQKAVDAYVNWFDKLISC